MTMKDGLCEVCGTGAAIGVASTSIPYSCAYCVECAQHGADPEWVLEHLLNEVAGGDPTKLAPGLITYKDGKYISFEEWAYAKPEKCEGCGIYPADPPSKLCPGCQAYQEHQQ